MTKNMASGFVAYSSKCNVKERNCFNLMKKTLSNMSLFVVTVIRNSEKSASSHCVSFKINKIKMIYVYVLKNTLVIYFQKLAHTHAHTNTHTHTHTHTHV